MVKKNVIYERYVFNKRDQEAGETFDNYVSTLRTLAQSCEFEMLRDQLIRDRIVCGIKDAVVRKKLLQEKELKLDRCIAICKAAEITSVQVRNMIPEEVHKVGQSVLPWKGTKQKCKFCGYSHWKGKLSRFRKEMYEMC